MMSVPSFAGSFGCEVNLVVPSSRRAYAPRPARAQPSVDEHTHPIPDPAKFHNSALICHHSLVTCESSIAHVGSAQEEAPNTVLRTRPAVLGLSLLIDATLICCTVATVNLNGILSAASATPAEEFAAITTGCNGAPRAATPYFQVTLYNVASGASPSASATVSMGSMTAPLDLSSASPDSLVSGAYFFVGDRPSFASPGSAVVISLKWSDGVGGSGSLGPQSVGIPTCMSTSRQSVSIAANQAGTGYWIVTSDGTVAGLGQAQSYGGMGFVPLNAPVVGNAATADSEGYWLLGADGGVFSFGTAPFFGSTANLRLNAPVVGMASTPDGGGYWFVAKDGGVFAFGDAKFYGSMGGRQLNRPIIGMTVDQATGGYWLVASDGGIFAFNAPFYGSTGNVVLNRPIIGMEAAHDGTGYRLGASDGGVFSFNLPFAGSLAGHSASPIVGIAAQGDTGYWLLDACGGVYSFGSAQFYGTGFTC
jgi:hypothetical protein